MGMIILRPYHQGGATATVGIPEGEEIMKSAEQKGFRSPDEVRKFEKGKVEVLKIGGGEVGRLTLEPGWRWSTHVKPVAKTEWCEAPHFQYHVSGRLHVKMADGSEFEVGPGEVSALPSGHDAWVVGNEPVVVVDWAGASNYAKGK
jgi:mannose-6-phosphate isomerase-like protein (cupin superfamily)